MTTPVLPTEKMSSRAYPSEQPALMHSALLRRRHAAARFAASAAVLFALHLATYFVPTIRDATLVRSLPLAVALAALALAQHLVVFPVVRALPAPRWAQCAAYAWLVLDMMTDVLQLAGAAKSTYLVPRLAVNLLAALWIASASRQTRGAVRSIGLGVALDFACYSCVALLSPLAFVVTIPSLVLLPVWFGLVARRLAASASLTERAPAVHPAA